MNHQSQISPLRNTLFSSDTKVLTPHRWKFIPDLLDSDKVAQAYEGFLEFVTPETVMTAPFDGVMHQVCDYHGKFKLEIAENSPFWFRFRAAPKVTPVQHFPKKGHCKQQTARSLPLMGNERHLTPLERLNIAFQADGSYLSKGTYAIRFSFSKQRKIDRLCWLADLAGYEYRVYALADARFEIHVYVSSHLMYKHFDWVKANNNGGNWCKEFIEELSHWDSHIRNANRIKFDTTTPSVMEKIEQVALFAGYGCLVSNYEDVRKDIFSDVYTANILKYATVGGQSLSRAHRQYSGSVSSITVPSGRLLTKKDRGTAIAVSNLI